MSPRSTKSGAGTHYNRDSIRRALEHHGVEFEFGEFGGSWYIDVGIGTEIFTTSEAYAFVCGLAAKGRRVEASNGQA